jgi:predicted nucleic acid-binding protein
VTVTVDINVLLDVFQQRQPHYASSAQLVSLIVAGHLVGICPAHGLTTLYYLVRKHASKSDAEAAMDRVLRHFEIGNLDRSGWDQARRLPLSDFEDAAVGAVAVCTKSSFIVTRNVDDFAGCSVPAITPADFLSQFTLPERAAEEK